MITVSKKELQALEKEGAKVKRSMGDATQEPIKRTTEKPRKTPAQKAKSEVPVASMSASMVYLEAQAEATRKVIARNSVLIEDFKEVLTDTLKQNRKRVPYVFDIERDKDKLITRIMANPQED